MFGVGRIAGALARRGPTSVARGVAGGVVGGGGRVAGAIAGRMASAPPGMSTSMSAAVPSTGLGAASDMKPPAGDHSPTEPRTFERGPNMTMPAEYRGQGSSLRSATRRNNRRAGRALSR